MASLKIDNIVQKALNQIIGFDEVMLKMKKKIIIDDLCESTYQNYIRKIAEICLHFNSLPNEISDNDLNNYFVHLSLLKSSPSRSLFKHMVYGLSFYYRAIGDKTRYLQLPSIKKPAKIPVILNKSELKKLFIAPKSLKHRIVLTLIYSAGLRSSELINLQIDDIDFERRTIHIHSGKNKKDRIIPLSSYIAYGLCKYIELYEPQKYLFNGKIIGEQYSKKGLSWILQHGLKQSNISKKVNLHSLRHCYATHLLEQGVDIITVKNLLGHSKVETTMIYLQIAQCNTINAFSPLDSLYGFM